MSHQIFTFIGLRPRATFKTFNTLTLIEASSSTSSSLAMCVNIHNKSLSHGWERRASDSRRLNEKSKAPLAHYIFGGEGKSKLFVMFSWGFILHSSMFENLWLRLVSVLHVWLYGKICVLPTKTVSFRRMPEGTKRLWWEEGPDWDDNNEEIHCDVEEIPPKICWATRKHFQYCEPLGFSCSAHNPPSLLSFASLRRRSDENNFSSRFCVFFSSMVHVLVFCVLIAKRNLQRGRISPLN